MMLPVSIFAVLLFASTGISAEDTEISEWRKLVCDKNNRTLFEEMDACFQKESEEIIKSQEGCAKEVFPSSNGNLVEFETEACKESSLFIEFDKCLEKNEKNSDADEKQMETPPHVQECYDEVFEKYDLPTDK